MLWGHLSRPEVFHIYVNRARAKKTHVGSQSPEKKGERGGGVFGDVKVQKKEKRDIMMCDGTPSKKKRVKKEKRSRLKEKGEGND